MSSALPGGPRATAADGARRPAFDPAMVTWPAGPDALVALDIDGTLLGHDGSLSDQVRSAVADLRDAGTHLVLSTGRSVPAVLPVARELGLERGWAVCSNGAVTVAIDPDSEEGFEFVDLVTFDPAPAVLALVAEQPGVIVAVEDVGRGFKVSAPFPMGELGGEMTVVDLEELLSEPATRVTLRAPELLPADFAELVERVGLHGVTYAVGWTAWLDITPDGVSKASALETVRGWAGVPRERTLAVGDGNNDREMLRWAALGVAMGGADGETVAAADATTPPVEEDGVVPVLRALLP